jgi:hypothetical protein
MVGRSAHHPTVCASRANPDEYLVCYDLPRMSGLWGVVIAPSAASIQAKGSLAIGSPSIEEMCPST